MKINNINKKLNLKNKLVLGALLAGMLTATGCSTKTPTKEENANARGINYARMNYGSTNEETSEYSFTLADCGNYRIGLSINASTLLADETLPTGIIIRTTVTKESEMYYEVDYVKGLVSKYNIDYPVFLDIDKLFELNDEMSANNLINIFFNKLQDNGLYVCIMGSKDNLNKTTNIADVDKMIVLDKDVLEESDNYNIVLLKDQFIVSGVKYDYVINKYGFNNEDRFLEDFSYNINDGETIWYLSNELGISEDLIMEYNKIDDETKISIGTEIIIPSIYGEYLESAKEKVKTIK